MRRGNINASSIISVTRAKERLSQILTELPDDGEVMITGYDKIEAVLIDIEEYSMIMEHFMILKELFDRGYEKPTEIFDNQWQNII